MLIYPVILPFLTKIRFRLHVELLQVVVGR